MCHESISIVRWIMNGANLLAISAVFLKRWIGKVNLYPWISCWMISLFYKIETQVYSLSNIPISGFSEEILMVLFSTLTLPGQDEILVITDDFEQRKLLNRLSSTTCGCVRQLEKVGSLDIWHKGILAVEGMLHKRYGLDTFRLVQN